MNERIKELAQQAEMAANKGDHVDVKIMMAKFAELIVRECGEYVGNKGMLAGGGCTVVGEEILMIADGLHKHFGVKE
jgi:hypothetical protein